MHKNLKDRAQSNDADLVFRSVDIFSRVIRRASFGCYSGWFSQLLDMYVDALFIFSACPYYSSSLTFQLKPTVTFVPALIQQWNGVCV